MKGLTTKLIGITLCGLIGGYAGAAANTVFLKRLAQDQWGKSPSPESLQVVQAVGLRTGGVLGIGISSLSFLIAGAVDKNRVRDIILKTQGQNKLTTELVNAIKDRDTGRQLELEEEIRGEIWTIK